MAAMIPFAAKGAQNASQTASKALTGDIYTWKRTRVVGKGKKAHIVEDELRINPISIGVGAAATAVGVGVALWIAQLKLQPVTTQQMMTVVDQAAYTEYITHDESGHWEDNQVIVGYRNEEVLGHWKQGAKGYAPVWVPTATVRVAEVATAPGQYWVVDVRAYTDTISHAAVTHQEPTGKMLKRYSVEQRQGFSMKSLADVVKESVGLGHPIFGDWSKGHLWAGSTKFWWEKK